MSYEGTKTQPMSSETQIPLENLEPKFANNIDQERLYSSTKKLREQHSNYVQRNKTNFKIL